AASRYGHGNIILMDDRFAIASEKILLFVIIVLDEMFHGILVAMLHFLPSNAQCSDSGF
ncbi:hypothetical protein BDK51DRAFT_4424, partial [Blyttiomyces helicus]